MKASRQSAREEVNQRIRAARRRGTTATPPKTRLRWALLELGVELEAVAVLVLDAEETDDEESVVDSEPFSRIALR